MVAIFMDCSNAPIPPPVECAAPPARASRWRWWVHLGLLTAYPLVLGVLGTAPADSRPGPMLPRASERLLALSAVEMVIFGVVFFTAWLASRASAEQLYLRWQGGIGPVLRGLGYSVALRMLVALCGITGMLIAHLLFQVSERDLKRALPHPETVIDPAAMTADPLYFWLTLTVVSFGVAGLREELWRAGMLAGLRALFPRNFQGAAGGYVAMTIVATVFGLGHAPQGGSAVVLTALLGAGLGAIMVRHRSIWDAVMAHGFFDATTFVMLYSLSKFDPQFLQGG